MSVDRPILDKLGALERIDGDEELYQEIVELYLDDAPKQLDILKDALSASDRELVERQAHSLKSASANIGAERLRAIAAGMEDEGRENNLSAASKTFESLLQEFEELKSYIVSLASV